MTFDQIVARIRRAMLLDQAAYEEARDDAPFTVLSLAAAGVAVVLAAIGAWLWGETVPESTPDGWFVDTVIVGTIFTAILFLIGIAVTYLTLSQVYRAEMDLVAFARVVGLTHVPYALSVFMFIPEVGFAFAILPVAAMFYYTVYGIRAAYPDVDNLRAMVSVALGFAVWAAVLPIITDQPDNNWVTGVFVYSLFD